MSRAIRFLAVVLLGSWSLASSPAAAHEGDPDYRSEVTSISPATPGLSAEIVNYDSDLVVENRSGSLVQFEGYEGEPYVRFLPDGTVEVNTNSPAYYLNRDRYATTEVPESADAKARPAWQQVAENGSYRWHDHRSHYMSESLPPQVGDRSKRTKIFDYSLPIKVDGERGAINGTLYWVGEPSPSKLPFILIAVGIVAAVVIVLVARRRRGRPGGGGEDGEPEDDAGREEAW